MWVHGRNNSNLNNGVNGHNGDTRSGQTHKKTEDLSARELEERGRGEGVFEYAVCMHTRTFPTDDFITAQ